MNYLTSGDPSKAPEIDIEEDHTMKEAAYQLIVAIANQGYTDKVMEAARSAGARGGTIVHTRSTGAEDAGKFLTNAPPPPVSRGRFFLSNAPRSATMGKNTQEVRPWRSMRSIGC